MSSVQRFKAIPSDRGGGAKRKRSTPSEVEEVNQSKRTQRDDDGKTIGVLDQPILSVDKDEDGARVVEEPEDSLELLDGDPLSKLNRKKVQSDLIRTPSHKTTSHRRHSPAKSASSGLKYGVPVRSGNFIEDEKVALSPELAKAFEYPAGEPHDIWNPLTDVKRGGNHHV